MFRGDAGPQGGQAFMASAPEVECYTDSSDHSEIVRLAQIGLGSFAGCFTVILLFLVKAHRSDNPGLGIFAFLADKFEVGVLKSKSQAAHLHNPCVCDAVLLIVATLEWYLLNIFACASISAFSGSLLLLGDGYSYPESFAYGDLLAVQPSGCRAPSDVFDHFLPQHSHCRSSFRRYRHGLDRDAISVRSVDHVGGRSRVPHIGAYQYPSLRIRVVEFRF